nr:uncharacterized protein K02A2.6-like [Rhipicephalus microplus]
MACVYGCERFYHFVYGRNVILETDHHPLLAIAQKPIGDVPPRLQRFFLRLMRYDTEMRFVPGKQLLLADMLSRAPTSSYASDVGSDDVEVHAASVVSSLVSDDTWKQLAAETSRDSYLKAVLHSLEHGLRIERQLNPFSTELTQVKGVLLEGCEVVIPNSLRKDTLERIHQGHMGINKCKERARRLVFWPGINADIGAFVPICAVRNKYAYTQPQEPLMMRPVLEMPWQKVGIDIFEYGGRSHFSVYDALSNFPEVEQLRDTSASSVIQATSAIFSRYGIPLEVLTNIGPQFSCHEFRSFSRAYDYRHITPSPGYPQSNGLAKKGVRVIKRILKKTHEAKQDFWLGLLAYRTTPLECGMVPPSGDIARQKTAQHPAGHGDQT